MTETEIKAKIERLRKNSMVPEKLKAAQIAKLEAQLASSKEPPSSGKRSGMYEIGQVVYNKKHKTIGIVRLEPERGELKTDADGNVDTDDLEHYDMLNATHNKAQIAPSTAQEIHNKLLKTLAPDLLTHNNLDITFYGGVKTKKKRGRQADPVKKAERRRKSHINSTITYKGKPIDDLKEDECRQLIKDLDERRESQAKSAKKSRSTPVVEKVLNNVVRAAKQAMKAVPAADIKDSPTGEIKKMKALAKLVQKFMIKVKALLGDDYDKEEVDAGLKEVRDVIKELEKKYK